MARMYRASTSGRVSRGLAVKSSAESAETRLTLTLVCVVAMFLLLVTPSELINLYFYAAKPAEGPLLEAAIVVTNALQTANFSFNFVLYLAVNAQFRGAVAEASHCSTCPRTCCCRRLRSTTAAITLETVVPTPLPRHSPAMTSTAAVNVHATPSHEGRPEATVSAVDVHYVEQRVALRRRGGGDDDERPVDEC